MLNLNDRQKKIAEIVISFFKAEGFTKKAIAVILGNIYAESALYPNNLQNSYNRTMNITDEEYTLQIDAKARSFIDRAGYGLCQWTSDGRKQGLLDFSQSKGVSISDALTQCEFIYKELFSVGYANIKRELVTNGAKNFERTNELFIKEFERPYDQSEKQVLTRLMYCNEFLAELEKGDTKMKLKDFITQLLKAVDQKTYYIKGCFGAPMTDANKARYSNNYEYNRKNTDKIMSLPKNTFGFDCICLIKAILWGWDAKLDHVYGGAIYASNGCMDVNETTFFKRYCREASYDWSTVKQGEALWMPGHIGIYLGEGNVIECTPAFKGGVQITRLKNIDASGEGHMWTKHAEIILVDYSDGGVGIRKTLEEVKKPSRNTYKVKKGDTLSKIAAMYNTDIDTIVTNNKAKYKTITRDHIVTGWTLEV